ncbi:MAG: helix-turn-helix domain-containing protein [Saccharofermentanales bacterium]
MKDNDIINGNNEDHEDSMQASGSYKSGKGCKEKHIDLYSLAASRAMVRLRKLKNLGQGEAAIESNLSPSYLSNVERGNHAISVNKLMSFSEGIDSNPEEICCLLCEEIAKCEEDMKSRNEDEDEDEDDDGD